MINAKIVADSIAPSGIRLTTFVLTYPRFIHSEFMTHRVFSRNASSSRAIPVKKQIMEVLKNPAMPIAFGANKAGMQAGQSFGSLKQFFCRAVWRSAGIVAAGFAYLMMKLNIHKQYANRIIEPWSHITVVCTSTEYANFFALRYHPMAQPEICQLAKQMWEVYKTNEPDEMITGEWHLPFVPWKEQNMAIQSYKFGKTYDERHDNLIKMSVARCARVSYLNHEGKQPTLEEDLKLYGRLVGSAPIHASPAEHQAVAVSDPDFHSGNFRGWKQYRKSLENENIEKFTDPASEQS